MTGIWDCNQSFLILHVFTTLHTGTLQNTATNITAAIFMKEDGIVVEMYTFCLSQCSQIWCKWKP